MMGRIGMNKQFEWIRAAMKKRGITQQQLSEETGLSMALLSQGFAGGRGFSRGVLRTLEVYFATPVGYLDFRREAGGSGFAFSNESPIDIRMTTELARVRAPLDGDGSSDEEQHQAGLTHGFQIALQAARRSGNDLAMRSKTGRHEVQCALEAALVEALNSSTTPEAFVEGLMQAQRALTAKPIHD